MDILTLTLTGIFIGFLASFLGIGGGLIAVPVLYFLYPDTPAQIIIATSMGIVFFNSTINSFYFFQKKGLPPIKYVLLASIPMIIGLHMGKSLIMNLDSQVLKMIFGVILLIVSLKTFVESSSKHNEREPRYRLNAPILVSFFIAGLVAGLTGLGGGVILVPLFKYVVNVKYKVLPAHTMPIISIVTLTGIVSLLMMDAPASHLPTYFDYFQVGYVNLGIILFLSVLTAISSKIGQKHVHKVPVNTLKIAFAILLLATSFKMLFW